MYIYIYIYAYIHIHIYIYYMYIYIERERQIERQRVARYASGREKIRAKRRWSFGGTRLDFPKRLQEPQACPHN